MNPTLEGAYLDMLKLLDSGRKLPTAFFAGNDIMAVGCIRAMQERGIRIPDDVPSSAWMIWPLCLVSNPPLSTIRVLRQEMGIAAVQSLLFVAAQMKTGVLKTELSVDLVERGSVRQIAPTETGKPGTQENESLTQENEMDASTLRRMAAQRRADALTMIYRAKGGHTGGTAVQPGFAYLFVLRRAANQSERPRRSGAGPVYPEQRAQRGRLFGYTRGFKFFPQAGAADI